LTNILFRYLCQFNAKSGATDRFIATPGVQHRGFGSALPPEESHITPIG